MAKVFSGSLVAFVLLFTTVDDLRAQGLPDINGMKTQAIYTRIKSEAFLDDLEAVESQRRRIEEINEQVWEDCRAIPQSKTKPKQILALLDKAIGEIFFDVFLRHQQIRFVQLVHQDELRRFGGSLSNYLVQPKVSKLIGIKEEKTKKLESLHTTKVEEIKKAAEQFRKRVAAILEDENKATLAILDNKQKKQITELIGEKNVTVVEGAEARIVLDQVIQERAK